MPRFPKKNKTAKSSSSFEEVKRELDQKQSGYREKALRIYPHVCARCGREFEGKKLKDLTVHHKDHNHDNNPSDGSNWELLCVYCHDAEHQKYLEDDHATVFTSEDQTESSGKYKPFAALEILGISVKKDE